VLRLTPSHEVLKAQLKWGFLLHTYGFACLFFILAFYAFFSILNLRSLISSRPFMSTINGFLCLLGISRAACLFIDPYNLREVMPKVLGSVLWDVGFPCITSAFCLIQLAFLQLTQLNLGPEKLRHKSCLSLIITAHFSFIIGADIAVGLEDQLMLVKYVVQLVFLCWGIFLCCTFLYGGCRVMGLLRNMPGGFLRRDPSDHQQKGIMQLALLAPYNNLASSVAAALVPTLLTPKIRITDENDRTFSYGSDSNNQLADANQQQTDVEYEPLPKGLVRPGSPDPRRRLSSSVQVRPPTSTPSIVVSPGSRRPSLASRRGSEIGSATGCQQGSEFSRRGSEISRRDSEISRRGSEISRRDSEISRRGSEISRRDSEISRRGSEISRRDSEISRRGSEISRRDSEISRRGSDIVSLLEEEVRCEISRRGSDIVSLLGSQQGSDVSRRGSEISRRDSEISRRGSDMSLLGSQQGSDVSRRSSETSRRGSEVSRRGSEAEHGPEELPVSPISLTVGRARSVPRKKSLTRQQSEPTVPCSKEQQHSKQQVVSCSEQSEDEVTAETSLLPHQVEQPTEEKTDDLTLHSILNHIAYVNRAALPNQSNMAIPAPTSRKSQVQKVLKGTYTTALLGLMLCVSDMGRLCGPYGLMAPVTNSTGMAPPWPWFCFQTLCRALEFAMGCAMANITKQPVNSRHQYLQQQYATSLRFKQHREFPYI
ncbi:hypothetical protein L798_02094, partial [Zootermopsis nevadensis]